MNDLEIDVKDRPGAGSIQEPKFAAANEPSYARTLFFGPDGLRPGWGVAFYVVAFLVIQRFAVQLAWAHNFGDSGLWSRMLEEFGDFVAAGVPAAVLARVECRTWGAYGLPLKQIFGRRFLVGALWGFAAISVVMVALYMAHAFFFGHIVLHGWRLLRFAAFWTIYFVLVGLFEEFGFRGYLQFTLARGVGFWPAALVLSCIFGLFHRGNEGERWSGVLIAILIGLFFCLTLRRTGNLWFAIGFHAAWDWGETFFYSVPDSGTVWPGHLLSSSEQGPTWLTGGSVGPEGSLLCFAVIALVWAAFDRVYPRTPSSLSQ
jgi:membrane protease YdiL (CAAX protease family)